jgi:prepilin-type N-terminal cleavage/methylation domain-containing protein
LRKRRPVPIQDLVLTRLRRDERGFGLLELLMAMTMLAVGLLAVIAAFSSGAFALKRASQTATASALGDKQMELYRAIRYDAITLEPGLVTTAGGDALYAANGPSGTVDATCADAAKTECKPMQTVTGPDKRTYRIDTYVVRTSLTNTREFKTVRVIVRDGDNLSRTLVREESTFDLATGT